jgi:hypothetical protein
LRLILIKNGAFGPDFAVMAHKNTMLIVIEVLNP